MSRDITEETFLLFVSSTLNSRCARSEFYPVSFREQKKKRKKGGILISHKEESLICENGKLSSAIRVKMITCQGNELPSNYQSVIFFQFKSNNCWLYTTWISVLNNLLDLPSLSLSITYCTCYFLYVLMYQIKHSAITRYCLLIDICECPVSWTQMNIQNNQQVFFPFCSKIF